MFWPKLSSGTRQNIKTKMRTLSLLMYCSDNQIQLQISAFISLLAWSASVERSSPPLLWSCCPSLLMFPICYTTLHSILQLLRRQWKCFPGKPIFLLQFVMSCESVKNSVIKNLRIIKDNFEKIARCRKWGENNALLAVIVS